MGDEGGSVYGRARDLPSAEVLTGLRFRIASRYRPFGVISRNFYEHRDDFSRRRDACVILSPHPKGIAGYEFSPRRP
jgi:hypothetical protein